MSRPAARFTISGRVEGHDYDRTQDVLGAALVLAQDAALRCSNPCTIYVREEGQTRYRVEREPGGTVVTVATNGTGRNSK